MSPSDFHGHLERTDMALKNECLYQKVGIDVTSTLFHGSSPSWSSGVFSSKAWTEDTPPGSDGSSLSSSRASSSEYKAAALEQSISQDDEPISYAEVKGFKFGYRKIMPSHIPTGWSNDPQDLEGISRKAFRDYNLDPPTLPVLVSDAAVTPRRYLVSNFGKVFFWIPLTSELLYVTECYNLEGILQRINDKYELRMKSLQPLALQYSQHQATYLSLWFWQIPRGWSQDIQELEDLKEMVSGQEYGLALLVPILVSDGRDGSTEFLIKCGDDFYLFCEISHELLHIDEPSELRGILSALNNDNDLNVTPVNYLPEYGGPNIVDDSNIPSGWSNKIDKQVSCVDLFYKHGIYGPDILLFWHGSANDAPKYLVEAECSQYIWETISDEIWRIDRAQGLQDILDILGDTSRYLTLSPVPIMYRSTKTTGKMNGEGELDVQRCRD